MKTLTYGALAWLACASAAHAELADAAYAADREKAIASLTPALKKNCVEEAAHKKKPLTPIGELTFSDEISRQVYQAFYWNGADRGVAFTLPVKVGGGEGLVGNVACFYALTGEGLKFQQAQQVVPRF